MNDEERQGTMDFILRQQAQFAVGMQRLEDADARASKRLDRLERTLVLMAQRFRRERADLRERTASLINAQIKSEDKAYRTDDGLKRIEDSHARSEARLTRLEALTESNSKAIDALTATTGRNSEDIAALTKVVADMARRRNGDDDVA
jgi:hypothetical protein